MRRDYQLAIILALAAIPCGAWITVAPEYLHLTGVPLAATYWVSMGLTAILLTLAVAIALRADARMPPKGHGIRMLAIIGMGICGFGFLAFATLFFIQRPSKTQSEQAQAPAMPDVTLRFVYPDHPALMLINESELVAKQIKWTVVLWNMDNPKVYSDGLHTPEAHEPLQIPVATFDFLRGGTRSIQNLLNSPLVKPHIKDGDRLFGSASVVCPDCQRGHTFVVDFVLGKGGWFSEIEDQVSGNVVIPHQLTKSAVIEYRNALLLRIPESARILIDAAF